MPLPSITQTSIKDGCICRLCLCHFFNQNEVYEHENEEQRSTNAKRKIIEKVIVVEKLLLLLDPVLARSLLLRCFSRGEKRNQGFESGVAGVVRIDFFASGMIILSVQH